jgi:DNA-binding SARP family transcriptional activator
MSTNETGMSIELLGPLQVRINHTPIMPRAAKPRQVLAVLALNAGRVVTVPTLIEELWGDQPPPSAQTTLQTYILELRKRIGQALGPGQDPKWVLRTGHNGYLLDPQGGQPGGSGGTAPSGWPGGAGGTAVPGRPGGFGGTAPPGWNDVDEFGRLAQAGRTAAESGDHRGATDKLGRALALWRGAALVDVRKGRVLELEAMALEESRLSVLSRRIDADLALGRHADMLGELTALAARYPLDECFSAQLITALYRTGHTARALQVFQRLRSALVEELGIEPSPQLQRLQRAILSRDPSLDVAAPPHGEHHLRHAIARGA